MVQAGISAVGESAGTASRAGAYASPAEPAVCGAKSYGFYPPIHPKLPPGFSYLAKARLLEPTFFRAIKLRPAFDWMAVLKQG